ncbi:MAG: TldD/PmbA family protein [Chloroflexota bacterium]
MSSIETVSHELKDLLRKYQADYIEAHLEESETSLLTYRGRELEAAGHSRSTGGNIRALVKGGWGFVSFNDFDKLSEKVALVVKQAELARREKSELAQAEAVVITAPPRGTVNPLTIPLAEKKRLLDEYNAIIWETPKLRTSRIDYGDNHRKRIYLSSSGSLITQEFSDVTLRLSAVAAKDGEVQQAGVSIGTTGEIAPIRSLHKEVQGLAERAVQLLQSPRAKGGAYTVVLDPILAGVFVHEAFGHLSESDAVYENDKLCEIMTLGREFGGKELNIVDGAAVPGLRGSYQYDDEGVTSTKTYLIHEGKLVGRLHSRETAAKMGEKPTGNARAINYHFPPIVRMTNTYIEPRKATFEELIADIKEGIYAKNWYGGTTSMEMFTFSAGEAYMIRNGRVAEMLKPVVLTGNIFTTLKNIDAIGSDLDFNQGGGCGKEGQSPLPVSNGSPHIRIRNCLVGGG